MHLILSSIRRALSSLLVLGLVAACSTEPDTNLVLPEDEGIIVATVNGEAIYFSDVELEAVAQGQIEPGSGFATNNPEFPQILEQLIDQKLLAQEALSRELHLEPTSRQRLEAGRERLLGNILVESLVANEVTEAAIDRMYDEQVKLQQLDDEVRLRLIIVAARADADQVLADLNAGSTFAEAALEHSQDARTRLEGGDLGWVRPNELEDPFPAVIGNTETGAVSEIFETERGWNILKVDERRTTPPKTKDEMRPEIITFLTFTQISDILRELRVRAEIDMRDVSEIDAETSAANALDETSPETE